MSDHTTELRRISLGLLTAICGEYVEKPEATSFTLRGDKLRMVEELTQELKDYPFEEVVSTLVLVGASALVTADDRVSTNLTPRDPGQLVQEILKQVSDTVESEPHR